MRYKATVVFSVSGTEPLPKQSFRSTRQRKYTPKRIVDWETTVAQAAMVAMVGAEPMLGPLTVAISFRRKSLRHVDLDNLSKAVLDACNEIVWRDDRQIDLLILKKTIGVDDPGIKVTVYER